MPWEQNTAPMAVHCTAGATGQQGNPRERGSWCLVSSTCLWEPGMKFTEKPQAVSWQMWCQLKRRGRWRKGKCSLRQPGEPITRPMTVSVHMVMGLCLGMRSGPKQGSLLLCLLHPTFPQAQVGACVCPTCLGEVSVCRGNLQGGLTRQAPPFLADAGVYWEVLSSMLGAQL